ncbi:MAG: hypothetical protein JSU87_14345 [Gemmatimonadota bacterium]|nr:MAG: hypothetical protein JSU87_14345 [Gemmatimonadota bacterium]
MEYGRPFATFLIVVVGLALAAFAWQQEGWTTPPAVSHALEGRDNCLMCHKPGAMEPVPDTPANHADRTNDMCLMCHAKDAAVQTTAPPAVTHDLQGKDNCLMCHKAGAMEAVPDVPADHEGRDNKYCGLCHMPAA